MVDGGFVQQLSQEMRMPRYLTITCGETRMNLYSQAHWR
jgi:hypothetical protein